MALEQNVRPISLPAGEDLTSHQWRFVKVGAGSTFVKAGAGEGVGVLQNKPTNGEAASVATDGVSFCEAGGAINEGDLVTTDIQGRAVAASPGDVVKGTAAGGASKAGVIFNLIVNVPTGLVSVAENGNGEGEGEGEGE